MFDFSQIPAGIWGGTSGQHDDNGGFMLPAWGGGALASIIGSLNQQQPDQPSPAQTFAGMYGGALGNIAGSLANGGTDVSKAYSNMMNQRKAYADWLNQPAPEMQGFTLPQNRLLDIGQALGILFNSEQGNSILNGVNAGRQRMDQMAQNAFRNQQIKAQNEANRFNRQGEALKFQYGESEQDYNQALRQKQFRDQQLADQTEKNRKTGEALYKSLTEKNMTPAAVQLTVARLKALGFNITPQEANELQVKYKRESFGKAMGDRSKILAPYLAGGAITSDGAKAINDQLRGIESQYGLEPNSLPDVPTVETVALQNMKRLADEFGKTFDFNKEKWAQQLEMDQARLQLARDNYEQAKAYHAALLAQGADRFALDEARFRLSQAQAEFGQSMERYKASQKRFDPVIKSKLISAQVDRRKAETELQNIMNQKGDNPNMDDPAIVAANDKLKKAQAVERYLQGKMTVQDAEAPPEKTVTTDNQGNQGNQGSNLNGNIGQRPMGTSRSSGGRQTIQGTLPSGEGGIPSGDIKPFNPFSKGVTVVDPSSGAMAGLGAIQSQRPQPSAPKMAPAKEVALRNELRGLLAKHPEKAAQLKKRFRDLTGKNY